jgi:pimeloyl-ACP methyl ester carboxylesterase
MEQNVMARKRGWLLGLGALAGVGAVAALRRSAVGDPTTDFTAHGFARRMVATPAGTMVYYEAGQGQPLIFLHGIGGGASSWIWSRVAPAFTSSYRVIVPDWVGWGLSEHPRRWLLPEDYVAELDALLRQIGEPALVVAQSLAAGFVADLACIKPELFKRLLLLAPSGGKDFGRDSFGPIARRIFTPLSRQESLNQQLYRAIFHRRSFIRSWLARQGFYDAAAVSDEIVNGFLYSARQPNAAYSALPFLSGDLRFDFAAKLRDLNVPAAMIWGAQERQVGRKTAERLAAINPAVPLHFIDRSRATPELEHPAQMIALIQRLLAEDAQLERTV